MFVRGAGLGSVPVTMPLRGPLSVTIARSSGLSVACAMEGKGAPHAKSPMANLAIARAVRAHGPAFMVTSRGEAVRAVGATMVISR